MEPEDLVSYKQIHEMCGVVPGAVANWMNRNIGFPEPWGQWDRFKLWKKDEIEIWWADRLGARNQRLEMEIQKAEERLEKLKEKVKNGQA